MIVLTDKGETNAVFNSLIDKVLCLEGQQPQECVYCVMFQLACSIKDPGRMCAQC